ncbi:MAG: hypothetical protein L0Y66_17015 [Myxococcaceae bacterium]|nr:hypothetical protein [Myxococcaceae bacterium]MCI0672310.1 hypothetical protein [Myxococcaceae bacterium]
MAISSRALLEQLTSGQPVSGFPPDAVEKARALAAAPAQAPSAEVEALPLPLALAVLDASVRARSPELALALGSAAARDLARAAKRALYQLRTSGVTVPEAPATPRAPAPTPAPSPAEALPAVATALAGTGDFALLLARPVRGGLEVLQLLLSDEVGVREVSRMDLPRGGYSKLVKQLRRDEQLPTLELTTSEATDEVALAAGRNLGTRTPFPQGLETVLRHLGVQPRVETEPLPPPTPEDVRLSNEGQTLHQEPEVAAWYPPERELRVLSERLAVVETSPLALSDVQRAEQILTSVRAQAHAFFTEPMRQLYARRLWWMARFFERTGRAHAAEVARAEARRLFQGELSPFPRFAEALFEKVLRMPSQPGVEAGAGEGVSGPAEPGGSAPPAERRSPGGILLP